MPNEFSDKSPFKELAKMFSDIGKSIPDSLVKEVISAKEVNNQPKPTTQKPIDYETFEEMLDDNADNMNVTSGYVEPIGGTEDDFQTPIPIDPGYRTRCEDGKTVVYDCSKHYTYNFVNTTNIVHNEDNRVIRNSSTRASLAGGDSAINALVGLATKLLGGS